VATASADPRSLAHLSFRAHRVCACVMDYSTSRVRCSVRATADSLTHLTGALLVDDAITFLCPDIHDGVQLPH
jgi:hypothetical protein